jgi:hypothetical protein
MGMDILRCKSPEMVNKEIVMHMIVYNCIRGLMAEAVQNIEIRVRQISFKGSLQAFRQWEPHLNQTKNGRTKQGNLIQLLYESIVGNILIERPGRSEPRAVKRRPKPYQLLNKPRHEMKEIKHRSRYCAEAA